MLTGKRKNDISLLRELITSSFEKA